MSFYLPLTSAHCLEGSRNCEDTNRPNLSLFGVWNASNENTSYQHIENHRRSNCKGRTHSSARKSAVERRAREATDSLHLLLQWHIRSGGMLDLQRKAGFRH